MTTRGYTASFGTVKGGLATVQRAWLNSARAVIGDWGGTVIEIVVGSGLYAIYEEPPAGAWWIAWRTGDAGERFLVSALRRDAFVFNFWPPNSGKSAGFTFLDSTGAAIGDEITEGVAEFQPGTGTYLAAYTTPPEGAVFVRARTIEAQGHYLTLSLEPETSTPAAPTGYSDDLDYNLMHSIRGFFRGHVDDSLGSELAGLTAELMERDHTVFAKKPNLMIHNPRRRPHQWTTGTAEFQLDFDDDALTVDTIGLEVWNVEIQCDLGCNDGDDRSQWARKIDVVLRTAEAAGGIPVYDYAGEGAAPTTQVGNIFCRYPAGVEHHNVDHAPEHRIFQDSIVLTFDYDHKYVMSQADDQLTGVQIGIGVELTT